MAAGMIQVAAQMTPFPLFCALIELNSKSMYWAMYLIKGKISRTPPLTRAIVDKKLTTAFVTDCTPYYVRGTGSAIGVEMILWILTARYWMVGGGITTSSPHQSMGSVS